MYFQIGTGNIAWQHHHLPVICSVAFSLSLKFAVGTEAGVLVWSLEGEVASTAERVAAARARSTTFWQRYPIDLRVTALPEAQELSPREDAVNDVQPAEHPFEQVARFVQVVTTKGASSSSQVRAAMNCLDSARSEGTVGSYGGSDGTADSIEVLDALRQTLDAAEAREAAVLQCSSGEAESMSELDDFDRRLAHFRKVEAKEPPTLEQPPQRQRSVQFEPLPASNKPPFVRQRAKEPPTDISPPPQGPSPAEILIAAKQGSKQGAAVTTTRQPFGVGQAI